MSNKTIFKHIRTKEVDMTIAMEHNLADNFYTYGISVCSKKDQFCKKTGRALATARIHLNKLYEQDVIKHLMSKVIRKDALDETFINVYLDQFNIDYIFSVIIDKFNNKDIL